MRALLELKKHLKPGQVYRRRELEKWSNAVDRHLKALVKEQYLQKMSQGLYYYPSKASFGEVPPDDKKLVESFLKTKDFLLTTPNFYNTLGVGTTQLYNKRIVYNHKRHGVFLLGGKEFDFRLKHKFPNKLTEDFLLVDLLNNLKELAEDKEVVLKNVKSKLLKKTQAKVNKLLNAYAGERTKALVFQWFK